MFIDAAGDRKRGDQKAETHRLKKKTYVPMKGRKEKTGGREKS